MQPEAEVPDPVPPAAEHPSYEDLRGARRISLMLRAAKLLCESGEYVCVVRDVSATGTKLRLFHEAPPETHLVLELANGDRFAMERMWLRDDHAGFRFAGTIDVDVFMEERSPYPRRPIRLNLNLPAQVRMAGIESQAMLVNMSQQGACIEAGSKLASHEQLRLDVEGLPPRIGHVCWRDGHKHGLVFQQSWRLDEFALHALALQPFGAPVSEARSA